MPWPRLFHNLRGSQATELCESHPAHVVAARMGHTVIIAQKHYLQVRDCDFERACQPTRAPEHSGARVQAASSIAAATAT